MNKLLSIVLLSTILSCSAWAQQDKEHDDREHEKAEKNLDHPHWEKAHGSGVPDKQPERKPPQPIQD